GDYTNLDLKTEQHPQFRATFSCAGRPTGQPVTIPMSARVGGLEVARSDAVVTCGAPAAPPASAQAAGAPPPTAPALGGPPAAPPAGGAAMSLAAGLLLRRREAADAVRPAPALNSRLDPRR